MTTPLALPLIGSDPALETSPKTSVGLGKGLEVPLARGRRLISDQEIPPDTYLCPGQVSPIGRSVHLARLQAGFAACQSCVHRDDTGSLPVVPIEQRTRTAVVERVPSGFRGVALAGLTEAWARRFLQLWAAQLWDSRTLPGAVTPREPHRLGRRRATGPVPNLAISAGPALLAIQAAVELAGDSTIDPESSDRPAGSTIIGPLRVAVSSPTATSAGPPVVVGCDGRPYSSLLLPVVVETLRRAGCLVIDIGLSTRAELCGAIVDRDAEAGLMLTGSGRPANWVGLDLLGSQGEPWPELDRLNEALAQPTTPLARAVRHAAGVNTFASAAGYRARLLRHFHALRPLTVCAHVANPVLLAHLEAVFGQLAGRLHSKLIAAGPGERRPGDADLRSLSEAVARHQADLGCLLEDDGERWIVVDQTGRVVPRAALGQLLSAAATQQLDLHGGDESAPQPSLTVSSIDGAADRSSRWKLPGQTTSADVLVLLGLLLQRMSWEETPLSRLAGLSS